MRFPALAGFEKYASHLQARDAALRSAGPDAPYLRQVMDSVSRSNPSFQQMGNGFFAPVTDAAVGGGMAFLEAELEKRDPKVREPLTSVTWMRDIIVKSGGGWVDFTSTFSVDYGISGPNFYGLSGTESTSIPIIQANISKDIFKVFNWQNILKVNFIDMQKLMGVGRSLDDMLDKGIKLNWNKTLDVVTYQGPFSSTAYPGLLNNPNVSATSVPVGGSGSTLWTNKTPGEIMADVNNLITATWAASNYDLSGMANHLLIPPTNFQIIANQPVTAAGSTSILTYLLANNIAKSQGVDLKIFPSRWCIGSGSGGTNRMMGYVNDDDRVYLDVTVPIQRVMTTPSIAEGGGAYLTLYAGQIGQVKILFYQPCAYSDGI